MTVNEDERLLTVRTGAGIPPQMRVTRDTVLGPLSIGSNGGWTIVAPGILSEHGYLYFDGADLFVQSADPKNPLLLNGQPVPKEWTPARSPCEIRLGTASIQFTNPGATVRISPLPPAPSPAAAPPSGSANAASVPFHPLSRTVMMDPPPPRPGTTSGPPNNKTVMMAPPSRPSATSGPPNSKTVMMAPPRPGGSSPPPKPGSVPPPPMPPPAFRSTPPPAYGGAAALPFKPPQQPGAPGFGSPMQPQVPPALDMAPTPEPPPAPRGPQPDLELPPKRRERPFSPGAFSNRDREPDPDATRLHPIEIVAAERGAKAQLTDPTSGPSANAEGRTSAPPMPAAEPFNALPPGAPPGALSFNAPPPGGEPFNAPPPGAPPVSLPSLSADPLAPPGMVPPGAAPPPGGAAPSPFALLKASWKEASGPKKALAVLLLPLIGAVWILFAEPPPQPQPQPRTPSTSASAITSATAKPSAAPALSSAAPEVSSAAAEKPTATPSARPVETSKPTSAPPVAAPATNSGGKTPQREAADAVAAGAFEEAAKLYEELAKAHPDVPAYAEAARILRTKVKK